jgi:hypothetical protein
MVYTVAIFRVKVQRGPTRILVIAGEGLAVDKEEFDYQRLSRLG